MKSDRLKGLLCIGDPHLATAAPGLRTDDYRRAILDKLSFCFDHARDQRLLPAILGDLFHSPHEGSAGLLDELDALLTDEVIAIAGNHDCSGPSLAPSDALARLADRGRVHLLHGERAFCGSINGRPVVVGGSPWGARLPERYVPGSEYQAVSPIVIWLVHLDLRHPDRGADGLEPVAIPGIDLIVNGHHHTRLAPVARGATTWCNPGSISRYSGSATARARAPSALQIDIDADGFHLGRVEIPHRPASEIFGQGQEVA
jgi:predicted phosphodiesterase